MKSYATRPRTSSASKAADRRRSPARGIYSAAQLREKIRPDRPYAPRQRLVEVEQTANLGGGAIWPLATLREIAQIAHAAGMVTHMDGARLLNASVASGVSVAEFARGFDSVWIDFSKGLGAPGGAVLAGSREFVGDANRWKQRIGGAMRQSGIIAAACEYALDHHVARLADDHANAKRLAEGIAATGGLRIDPATVENMVERLPEDHRSAKRLAAGLHKLDASIIDPATVETNLVYFDVTAVDLDAEALCNALLKRGVRMGPMSARTVRAVTHLDVSADDIETALAALRAAAGADQGEGP